MAIDPLGQGSTRHAAHRAGEAARSQDVISATTPKTAESAPDDQLLLSPTATDASAEVDVPAGTLSADALRVITERLASGHYDSAAVADRVAGKLLAGGEI